MKYKVLHITLIISIFISISFHAEAQIKSEIIGNWNFKCPNAPAIFGSGVIYIHQDTVFTAFTGIWYMFPFEWVKEKEDTLFYNIKINGDDQLYVVIIENRDSLNGLAVTGYGASP